VNGRKTGFLILALVAVILAGCMPSQRELRMEKDLGEMKRRLAQNEKGLMAVQQSHEAGDRFKQLARQQADLQAGIDAVRVRIQKINGRMEELVQRENQLDQKLSLLQKDLGMKVASLEGRVEKLESRPAPKPAVQPAPEESPHALYERGLDLIRKKGDFTEGQQVLRDFLKRYPNDKLAVNAMYWIGEADYGEKKYEEAILQFQDVIQKYGHHPKVAAALLKQGLAFHALGDDQNARPILQKLIDTFPKSEEAKKAKTYLQEWKGKK